MKQKQQLLIAVLISKLLNESGQSAVVSMLMLFQSAKNLGQAALFYCYLIQFIFLINFILSYSIFSILFYFVLFCSILFYFVLFCFILFHFVLFCFLFCFFILFYFILLYFILIFLLYFILFYCQFQ